jgi:hypothetical protein
LIKKYASGNELKDLVEGVPLIDIEEWEVKSVLKGFGDSWYLRETESRFWLYVRSLDKPGLRKLLAFTTGSYRPLSLGFENLDGGKFTIVVGRPGIKVPQASHENNTLDLPFCKSSASVKLMMEDSMSLAEKAGLSAFYTN